MYIAKRCLIIPLLASTVMGLANDGPNEREFLLQTKNTSIVFRQDHESWLMVHYGSKIEEATDVTALAWSAFAGRNFLGDRKPATYSVYGSDTQNGGGMNKFGGLAVIHADGVTSTELKSAAIKQVPDVPGVTHVVFELEDVLYPYHVGQHFFAQCTRAT